MKIKGKVHRFGVNVNTDVILPARYLDVDDAKELAKHCMEDLDAGFIKRVQTGDIIVAISQFRLWVLPRACSGSDQSLRGKSGYRQEFRTDFLSKCDQHRAGHSGERGCAGGRRQWRYPRS